MLLACLPAPQEAHYFAALARASHYRKKEKEKAGIVGEPRVSMGRAIKLIKGLYVAKKRERKLVRRKEGEVATEAWAGYLALVILKSIGGRPAQFVANWLDEYTSASSNSTPFLPFAACRTPKFSSKRRCGRSGGGNKCVGVPQFLSPPERPGLRSYRAFQARCRWRCVQVTDSLPRNRVHLTAYAIITLRESPNHDDRIEQSGTGTRLTAFHPPGVHAFVQ